MTVGTADLSELLTSMDNRIIEAKEHALSRKDILEKVDKWKLACVEETWLDEYERVPIFFPNIQPIDAILQRDHFICIYNKYNSTIYHAPTPTLISIPGSEPLQCWSRSSQEFEICGESKDVGRKNSM
jgi:hypothetical protein